MSIKFKKRWNLLFFKGVSGGSRELIFSLDSFNQDAAINVLADPYIAMGAPIYSQIEILNLDANTRHQLQTTKDLTVELFAGYTGGAIETSPLKDHAIYSGAVVGTTTTQQVATPDLVDTFYCLQFPTEIFASFFDRPFPYKVIPKGTIPNQLQTLLQGDTNVLPGYSLAGLNDFKSLTSEVQPAYFYPAPSLPSLITNYCTQHRIALTINPIQKTVHLLPVIFNKTEVNEITTDIRNASSPPEISQATGLIGQAHVDATSGIVQFNFKLDNTLKFGSFVSLNVSTLAVDNIRQVAAPGGVSRQIIDRLKTEQNRVIKIMSITYSLSTWGTTWDMSIRGISPSLFQLFNVS